MAHVSAKPRPMMAPPGVRHGPAVRAPSRRDEGTIGKYRVTKTIGKGNFAKVKLARHIPTGREVAIKIVDKTQLNASSLQKMLREVRIMKMLDHPNIVKLIEVIETDRHMYLVLEYCSGGELFDYIVKHGKLKEADARTKFRQVLSAVEYLHQKSIVHRDLKAENLLLDGELNVKLADFGFSNEFLAGRKLDTFCGSPPYAAPELFQGKKYDGPEVDVWSVGVILYILICGCLPFDGTNLKELRERVLKGKYRVPFYMSTDCETLLKKFLSMNPAKRTSLQAALKEKWINVDNEDMKPYVEPKRDVVDVARVDTLATMGYSRKDIEDSLKQNKFNEIQGTYALLMGRRPSAASGLPAQQRRAPMSTFSQLVEQSSSMPKEGDTQAGSSGSAPRDGYLHTGGSVPRDGHLSGVDEGSPEQEDDTPGTPVTPGTPATPGTEPFASTCTSPTTPTDMTGDVGEHSVTLNLAEENSAATPVKVKKKKKKTRTRSSDDVTRDTTQHTEDNGVANGDHNEDAIQSPESAAGLDTSPPETGKANKKVSHKKSVKASKMAATPDITPATDLDLALAAVADPTDTSPLRQTSVDPATKVKVKSKSHVQRHATTVGYGDSSHHKGLTSANERLPSASNDLPANQKQANEAPLTNQKQSPAKTTADAAANSQKRSSKDDNNLQSEANAPDNPYFARGQGGRSTFHGSAAPSRPLTSYPSHDPPPSLLNKFVSKFQQKKPEEAVPDDGVRVRSVHVLTADVLSGQDPDVMLTELKRALTVTQCRSEVQSTKYVLLCSHGDKSHAVQWEAEVCRLPLRATNAIRYKKITGSSSHFKTIVTRLSSEMKL